MLAGSLMPSAYGSPGEDDTARQGGMHQFGKIVLDDGEIHS